MLDDLLSSEDSLPRGYVLGKRYEIKELVGSGGMAKVYCAFDHNLRMDVALKVLEKKFYSDDEDVHRFYREGRAAARLNHKNIARVYDVQELEGKHCICIEFVQGKTLDKLMSEHFEQKRFFPTLDACIIIREVLDALKYAHDEGIIHRDVKPSNIMISNSGEVKITDFGIAKLIKKSGKQEQTILTKELTLIGTPQYMSPEQIRQEKINEKTDVFSTGIVFYEMLTGRLPFANVKEAEITTAITNILIKKLQSPKIINKKIPGKLEDILLRALEKNPEKRYDAEGFYNALDSYLNNEAIQVEGSFRRRFEIHRREFLIKGIAATLGMIALIGMPTFIITKHNAYEKSLYSTIDKIQSPEINNMAELTALLTKEAPKIYKRLEWIYDVELTRQLKSEEKKEKPMVYPLGSFTMPSRDGEYGYLTGDSGFAGYICPIIYYLFDEIENRIQNEKDPKQKIKLQEKNKKILNDFFYYATHLYFVEQNKKGDGITKSDEETLVLDRFYYPAKEVIISLQKNHPELFIKREEVNKIANKIISNYAKAIKIAVEKRYNPKKGFIEQTDFNKNEVNAVRDNGIALMLCDGFRLLDIKKQVLSEYPGYGNQIQSVKEYLDLIISDADVKIKKLVKSDTWRRDVPSKDYIGLLLGLTHRRNLLQDIVEGKDTKYDYNSIFASNISNLATGKNEPAPEYIAGLVKKKEEYSQIILGMINYLIPKISHSTILGYYLEDKPENPRDTIATLRLLEALSLYDKHEIKGINLEETEFRIYKDLFSRQNLYGKNFLPVSRESPLGFVKDTQIHIQYVQAAGGTCIESDYFFLKNLCFQLNKK